MTAREKLLELVKRMPEDVAQEVYEIAQRLLSAHKQPHDARVDGALERMRGVLPELESPQDAVRLADEAVERMRRKEK